MVFLSSFKVSFGRYQASHAIRWGPDDLKDSSVHDELLLKYCFASLSPHPSDTYCTSGLHSLWHEYKQGVSGYSSCQAFAASVKRCLLNCVIGMIRWQKQKVSGAEMFKFQRASCPFSCLRGGILFAKTFPCLMLWRMGLTEFYFY